MKYAIIIGDGMGDYPIPDLDGRTPLGAADKPNMDHLAQHGIIGTASTLPPGMPMGSDVAHFSLFGYDPSVYYPGGRGPLEAAGMGLEFSEDEIIFRCNLVTVKDGLMHDHSGGHITTEEGEQLIKVLNGKLAIPKVKFVPGVGYRHLMVALDLGRSAVCIAPHDILGSPIDKHLPTGEESSKLRDLMLRSRPLLDASSINTQRRSQGKDEANMIWLWGQGSKVSMPSFQERFGLRGAIISAVDLIRGIGLLLGFKIIPVPGITGYLDTNYSGKAEYALRSLQEHDLVIVHVEAPDEAGHNGDLNSKVRAIEDFDQLVVGAIRRGLEKFEDYKIMIVTDHYTPVSVRTHTDEAVPYVIYCSDAEEGSGEQYDEESAKRGGPHFSQGYNLMEFFLKNGKSDKR